MNDIPKVVSSAVSGEKKIGSDAVQKNSNAAQESYQPRCDIAAFSSGSKASVSSYEQIGQKLKRSGKRHSVSESYAKLAGASSKSQIHAVMSDTQREIADLRMTSAFGDPRERMKARAAMASLQKLLRRGGRKIRRLNEEELVKIRKKQAKKQEKIKKELALKQELKRMRSNRQSADRCIVEEGRLEEMNTAFAFRHKENKYEHSSEADPVAASASAPAAISAAAPAAAPEAVSEAVSVETPLEAI